MEVSEPPRTVRPGARPGMRVSKRQSTPEHPNAHHLDRETGAQVRAHPRLRARPGRIATARKGDRREDGQQGARPARPGADLLTIVDERHVVVAARRPPVRHQPAEGADEGPALQRGQAARHRGPVEDDQGPAAARRRRQEALGGTRMAPDLSGQTIAFLVADEGVEEVEMIEPWKAIENAGGTPELVSPNGGKVQAFNHLDKSKTYDADQGLDDADPSR